jgi:hypothetical protein
MADGPIETLRAFVGKMIIHLDSAAGAAGWVAKVASTTPERLTQELRAKDCEALATQGRDALTRIAELEANRCEHCGATLYSGPPDCPRCGAPQCCPSCCRVAEVEARLAERDAEIERLRGVNLERLWRINGAVDAAKQNKDADLIVVEMRHALVDADKSELMEFAREHYAALESEAEQEQRDTAHPRCNEVVNGRLCQLREDHEGECGPLFKMEPTDG